MAKETYHWDANQDTFWFNAFKTYNPKQGQGDFCKEQIGAHINQKQAKRLKREERHLIGLEAGMKFHRQWQSAVKEFRPNKNGYLLTC